MEPNGTHLLKLIVNKNNRNNTYFATTRELFESMYIFLCDLKKLLGTSLMTRSSLRKQLLPVREFPLCHLKVCKKFVFISSHEGTIREEQPFSNGPAACLLLCGRDDDDIEL